jgi:hypothetical protein
MVPEKRSNKVGGPALCAAEGVEGGELLAKCNSGEQKALRTQSREQGAPSARTGAAGSGGQACAEQRPCTVDPACASTP